MLIVHLEDDICGHVNVASLGFSLGVRLEVKNGASLRLVGHILSVRRYQKDGCHRLGRPSRAIWRWVGRL